MEANDNMTQYKKAQNREDGKKIYDFVLDPLDWDVRQQGIESEIFKKEVQFHKKVAPEKFVEIFVSKLIVAKSFENLEYKARVSWFLEWRIDRYNEKSSGGKIKMGTQFFLFWPPDHISVTTGPTKMVHLS